MEVDAVLTRFQSGSLGVTLHSDPDSVSSLREGGTADQISLMIGQINGDGFPEGGGRCHR
jgi:hypothetical protein